MKNKKINFATIIFVVGALVLISYLSTYWFTITDNAFIVSNQTPISASVSGKIAKIYVENGQLLKKGDPILLLHQDKYKLDYISIKTQYDQALVGLKVLEQQIRVTQLNLNAAQDQLNRLNYEYAQKSDKSVSKGIPGIELKNLYYNIQSQANIVASLKEQKSLQQTQLKQAQVGINSLKANSEIAAINVADTLITAPSDGYIQNLYFGIGKAATQHEGLFDFIDVANTYVQANFNETDLAHVRAGDKVWILPRAYLGHKVFHGIVLSDNWSTDRQHIIPLKGSQVVLTENHWLNLPQRMPVQIKIIDLDNKFPLRPGMSTYVYIQTK